MSTRDDRTGAVTQSAKWTDTDIEMLVGRLLQVGVMIAAVITVVGGAMYLARHSGEVVQYHVFRDQPSELRTVRGVVGAIGTLQPGVIIQLGLLVLIATPIARVAMSIIGFAREQDRMYVGITVLVFALLMYGLFGGG